MNRRLLRLRFGCIFGGCALRRCRLVRDHLGHRRLLLGNLDEGRFVGLLVAQGLLRRRFLGLVGRRGRFPLRHRCGEQCRAQNQGRENGNESFHVSSETLVNARLRSKNEQPVLIAQCSRDFQTPTLEPVSSTQIIVIIQIIEITTIIDSFPNGQRRFGGDRQVPLPLPKLWPEKPGFDNQVLAYWPENSGDRQWSKCAMGLTQLGLSWARLRNAFPGPLQIARAVSC